MIPVSHSSGHGSWRPSGAGMVGRADRAAAHPPSIVRSFAVSSSIAGQGDSSAHQQRIGNVTRKLGNVPQELGERPQDGERHHV